MVALRAVASHCDALITARRTATKGTALRLSLLFIWSRPILDKLGSRGRASLRPMFVVIRGQLVEFLVSVDSIDLDNRLSV